MAGKYAVRDESRHPIRSLAYVQTQGGSVALDLDGHRLERLEEHRAGGVLTMKMQLWPRIEMEGTTTDARVDEIRFQVPRDDWLAIVATFTGEQIDVLEVRYHLAYARLATGQASQSSVSRETRWTEAEFDRRCCDAGAKSRQPHGGIRQGSDRRRPHGCPGPTGSTSGM